jgi:hypothetical protein
LRSSARGKLPLGFARKPVGLSRRFRQPCDKLLGIAPAYIRDRRFKQANWPDEDSFIIVAAPYKGIFLDKVCDVLGVT